MIFPAINQYLLGTSLLIPKGYNCITHKIFHQYPWLSMIHNLSPWITIIPIRLFWEARFWKVFHPKPLLFDASELWDQPRLSPGSAASARADCAGGAGPGNGAGNGGCTGACATESRMASVAVSPAKGLTSVKSRKPGVYGIYGSPEAPLAVLWCFDDVLGKGRYTGPVGVQRIGWFPYVFSGQKWVVFHRFRSNLPNSNLPSTSSRFPMSDVAHISLKKNVIIFMYVPCHLWFLI